MSGHYQFLNVVDDSSTGKFYVHCTGGRHRTGVMDATEAGFNFKVRDAKLDIYDSANSRTRFT